MVRLIPGTSCAPVSLGMIPERSEAKDRVIVPCSKARPLIQIAVIRTGASESSKLDNDRLRAVIHVRRVDSTTRDGGVLLSRRGIRSWCCAIFFTVIAVLGIGTSAYAVPVQTTYSYVGAYDTYQPGVSATEHYAPILGPRLTYRSPLTATPHALPELRHRASLQSGWISRRDRSFV
jgi:hypothetical protein